jgi:selenoprotein W-related protein
MHTTVPYSIAIKYCTKCKWLLRSSWMAQELLTTFEQELAGVSLEPSTTSGVFEIRVNQDLIWSRQAEQGFPEIKQLKQLVRDIIAPARNLGHIDAPGHSGADDDK